MTEPFRNQLDMTEKGSSYRSYPQSELGGLSSKFSANKLSTVEEKNKYGITKIFVHGLHPDTTCEELLDTFSPFCEITELIFKRDPVTGKHNGYAFFTVPTPEDAVRLVEADHHLHGRFIHCDLKHTDPEEQLKNQRRRLFVGGLRKCITDEELKRAFERFGRVRAAYTIKDDNGKSKSFGYVDFADEESAKRALETTTMMVGKRKVDLRPFKRRKKKNEGTGSQEDRMSSVDMGVSNMSNYRQSAVHQDSSDDVSKSRMGKVDYPSRVGSGPRSAPRMRNVASQTIATNNVATQVDSVFIPGVGWQWNDGTSAGGTNQQNQQTNPMNQFNKIFGADGKPGNGMFPQFGGYFPPMMYPMFYPFPYPGGFFPGWQGAQNYPHQANPYTQMYPGMTSGGPNNAFGQNNGGVSGGFNGHRSGWQQNQGYQQPNMPPPQGPNQGQYGQGGYQGYGQPRQQGRLPPPPPSYPPQNQYKRPMNPENNQFPQQPQQGNYPPMKQQPPQQYPPYQPGANKGDPANNQNPQTGKKDQNMMNQMQAPPQGHNQGPIDLSKIKKVVRYSCPLPSNQTQKTPQGHLVWQHSNQPGPTQGPAKDSGATTRPSNDFHPNKSNNQTLAGGAKENAQQNPGNGTGTGQEGIGSSTQYPDTRKLSLSLKNKMESRKQKNQENKAQAANNNNNANNTGSNTNNNNNPQSHPGQASKPRSNVDSPYRGAPHNPSQSNKNSSFSGMGQGMAPQNQFGVPGEGMIDGFQPWGALPFNGQGLGYNQTLPQAPADMDFTRNVASFINKNNKTMMPQQDGVDLDFSRNVASFINLGKANQDERAQN